MRQVVLILAGLVLLVGAGLWLNNAALSPKVVAQRPAVGSQIDWDSVQDDESRRLEISWLGLPRYPNGQEGGYIERLIEDTFNVELKPVLMDAIAYERKKPLKFASGNIPDVTWEADPIDLQRDVYHGFIIPVPFAVIKRYAPHFTKLSLANAPIGWLYAHCNGRNYGIPTIYLGGAYPAPGVWRKDWLDRIGMAHRPETLEQFHEALQRFTFDDPDGDGRSNTYGMSGNVNAAYGFFPEFFGAFGVTPFNWIMRDGRAVYGGILPETKQALEMLRQWYDEGIIDPEFITDGTNNCQRLRNKFANGHLGYRSAGFRSGATFIDTFDPTNSRSTVTVMNKLDPNAELAASAYPRGSNGSSGIKIWGTGGNILAFGRQVEQHPEKVIRVLKILDRISMDEKLYMQASRGRHGVHWDYRVPDTGEPGTGPSSGIRYLPPYDDVNVYKQEVLGSFFGGGGLDPDIEDKYTWVKEIQFRSRYRDPAFGVTDLFGKVDIMPSAKRYFADLSNWQQTIFAEIIRGDRDLDYFETFREEWHRRGGSVLTEEANELRQVKNQIYDMMGVVVDR